MPATNAVPAPMVAAGEEQPALLIQSLRPGRPERPRQIACILHDRSIHIPLIQAERRQIKAWFDESNADPETFLNHQLATWSADNFDAIRDCAARILRPLSGQSAINSQPSTLPAVHNRLGDNWRPLFAIAEIAGGHSPQLAADAFTQLTHPAGRPTINSQLPTLNHSPAFDKSVSALNSHHSAVIGIQIDVTRVP